MQDKTIVSICMGITSMVLIALCYIVYMVFGPGGDGMIFGTVMTAIGAILGVVIGIKITATKTEDQQNADNSSNVPR
jgi:hypothetical protein